MTPRSRPDVVWSAALVAGLVALASCTSEPGSNTNPANVLLITVDTLRPDALGWVAGKNATPSIDALAQRGFRFPAAVAPAPLTLPSHVSLMMGLLPRRHGVRDNGLVLGAAGMTLAEALRSDGYQTAAFVSGYPLHSMFGLNLGFDRYDDTVSHGEGAWRERPARETTTAAKAWLKDARSPWFLWVHYYDPHYPYEPPSGLMGPGPRGAYDGEVRAVDQAVSDLLAAIDAQPPAPMLTVFAGDHGESLGEHGEGTHGFFIYDSTILVPMVIEFPDHVAPGQSGAPARLIDVAPTVLDLLGQPGLAGVDGTSLVPLLKGERDDVPPAMLETLQPWRSYGWAPLRAVRQRGWKLIEAPRPELYDLEKDPGERENRFEQQPELVSQLRQALSDSDTAEALSAAEVQDPEARERLESLGYVQSKAAPPADLGTLKDPKDAADTRRLLTEADELLGESKFLEALNRLEPVLALEPDNRFALSRSAAALVGLGRHADAIPRLRRVLELDPTQPESRALLAEALTRSNQLPEAIEEWRALIRLQPRLASAWSNLGATLGRAGRTKEAIEALTQAAELEPDDSTRLVRLAFAERSVGETQRAIEHLRQAAALEKDEFIYSSAMGLMLAESGDKTEALTWLQQGRPAEADYAAAQVELARIQRERGDVNAARAAVARALEVKPNLRGSLEADPQLKDLLKTTP